MLFRQIVLYALLAGAVSGLLVTGVEYWSVVPIIESAESFEGGAASEAAKAHEHGSEAGAAHDHGGGAWAPSDGMERTAFMLLSNVLGAIGFALVLLAAMAAALKLNRITKVDWRYGFLWGAAGYAVFFLAPALGMLPDVPGTAVASLEARQLWWLLAVVCTAGGLAGVAFVKSPWRWAALVLLAVPYVVGAPAGPSEPFPGQPPAAAAELKELTRQFFVATAVANAVLWAALGAVSGWAAPRIVSPSHQTVGDRHEFAR